MPVGAVVQPRLDTYHMRQTPFSTSTHGDEHMIRVDPWGPITGAGETRSNRSASRSLEAQPTKT